MLVVEEMTLPDHRRNIVGVDQVSVPVFIDQLSKPQIEFLHQMAKVKIGTHIIKPRNGWQLWDNEVGHEGGQAGGGIVRHRRLQHKLKKTVGILGDVSIYI